MTKPNANSSMANLQRSVLKPISRQNTRPKRNRHSKHIERHVHRRNQKLVRNRLQALLNPVERSQTRRAQRRNLLSQSRRALARGELRPTGLFFILFTIYRYSRALPDAIFTMLSLQCSPVWDGWLWEGFIGELRVAVNI